MNFLKILSKISFYFYNIIRTKVWRQADERRPVVSCKMLTETVNRIFRLTEERNVWNVLIFPLAWLSEGKWSDEEATRVKQSRFDLRPESFWNLSNSLAMRLTKYNPRLLYSSAPVMKTIKMALTLTPFEMEGFTVKMSDAWVGAAPV